MYKYIFLDLDDTIWDFHANAKNSLNVAFNQLRLNNYFENFDEFFQIYMKRNNELWDEYGEGKIIKDFLQMERFRYPLVQAGVTDEDLSKKMGKMYLDLLPERTMLVPYAKELLDYLSAKYRLTIISNGFIEVQHKKLNNSKINHYFDHVVLSEEAKALKPDKRIFDFALELNNAKPTEAIMIGDIYQADILGAQNAGIDQIFFNWRKKEMKEDETATYSVETLKEIFEIL